MLDKSRMVLCMALFGIFIINPFGSLLAPKIDRPLSDASTILDGRTILSMEGFSNYSWLDLFKLSASTLLLSAIYIGLFLLGMIKIFIYGEANIPESSASMKSFWVHRKQADMEMKLGKKRHEKIRRHLALASEALGRPIPTGRIELLLSTFWQCLHQALHRLGIARWFVKRAGGFTAKTDVRKDIARARKESALAYHQLHQVHMCVEERDQLMGFFLAMAAVNLAEASGQELPGNFRSHAYAMLSLRIRHSLPRIVNFLSRFYMFKAKYRQQKNQHIDANLAWLLTKPGQSFFARSDWFIGQECSKMTSAPENLNPLALVGQYFRDSQLKKALSIVVSPGQATGRVQEALELVQNSEASNSCVDIGELKPCQDEHSRWWASVLATACHWMREELEEASKLFQALESYPVRYSVLRNQTQL